MKNKHTATPRKQSNKRNLIISDYIDRLEEILTDRENLLKTLKSVKQWMINNEEKMPASISESQSTEELINQIEEVLEQVAGE